MTPDAQRIAIAEACGWSKKPLASPNSTGNPMWHNPSGAPMGFIPDYLNDLNAMREAEKVMNDNQQFTFIWCLIGRPETKGAMWSMCWDSAYLATHSTAAQRAEAFLHALNPWKGTPYENHKT